MEFRVFAMFSETRDIVVEAETEDEAYDKAFSTDFEEWDLFATDFDGSEIEEL